LTKIVFGILETLRNAVKRNWCNSCFTLS